MMQFYNTSPEEKIFVSLIQKLRTAIEIAKQRLEAN